MFKKESCEFIAKQPGMKSYAMSGTGNSNINFTYILCLNNVIVVSRCSVTMLFDGRYSLD